MTSLMTMASKEETRVLGTTATRPVVMIPLVIGFALLTWAGAKVRIPMPFTPVPGTLQTLPVLLSGALLGARAGLASQTVYLLLGLAGLPVFALPGAGPAYFLGPTGGYLLGFLAAAYVTGRIHGLTRSLGTTGALLAFAAGTAALYLCGLSWLAAYLGGNTAAAVRAGLAPFAAFDLAKIIVATGIDAAWRRAGPGRTETWKDATSS